MPGSVTSHPELPRERVRSLGAQALSLAELLVALVGSGGAHGSAREIAHRLEARFGSSVRGLARTDPAELQSIPGVGPAVATRVVVAIELGRRLASEEQDHGSPIRGPADVFRRYGPRLRDLPQEEFHAVVMNTRHRVIREVFVTRGTVDASLIHPREVFRAAVQEGASAVILVHNHPSGDPTPSPEDRVVTRQLAAAGRTLGIPVLDHVVIGDGRYVSLADELGEP